MVKVFSTKRKITVDTLLGLDPDDVRVKNWLAFRDLIVGLQKAMIEKKISKNELARRLGVSRQAIYDKFSGRNVSMKWIQKACDALGVTIRFAIVDKKRAA